MSGYEDDKASRTALKSAILHPSEYGKTLEEMGWADAGRKIIVPHEKAKLVLNTLKNSSAIASSTSSLAPAVFL